MVHAPLSTTGHIHHIIEGNSRQHEKNCTLRKRELSGYRKADKHRAGQDRKIKSQRLYQDNTLVLSKQAPVRLCQVALQKIKREYLKADNFRHFPVWVWCSKRTGLQKKTNLRKEPVYDGDKKQSKTSQFYDLCVTLKLFERLLTDILHDCELLKSSLI